jgi:hypothetical protein
MVYVRIPVTNQRHVPVYQPIRFVSVHKMISSVDLNRVKQYARVEENNNTMYRYMNITQRTVFFFVIIKKANSNLEHNKQPEDKV